MTPKHLILKNFIGIKAGQGKSEFVLDLEPILRENQLIAIVGNNGSGKTTVMDNLHPYRIMPSRAAGTSPGSFSFYDNTIGEALKELEWEHEGIRYKSTLLIKSTAKTKTTTAYLHRQVNGNWEPAAIADGTVSDGKTATYDAVLEAILGTPEMFFTSVFSPQGKKALSSYTNSEIKALMAELLDLEHIRDLQAKARDVVKELRRAHDGLNSQLAEIASKGKSLSDKKAEIESGHRDIRKLESDKTSAREAVDRALLAYREAQQDNSANQKLEERRTSLQTSIAGANKKRFVLEREIVTLDQSKQQDLRQIQTEIETTGANLSRSTGALQLKIAEQSRILEMSADIDSAKLAVIELETETERVSETVRDKTEAQTRRQKLEVEQATTHQKLTSVLESGKQVSRTCKEAEQRAALIKEVPCAGTEYQPACKLLRNANEAAALLPELTARQDECRKRYTLIKSALANLASQIEGFSSVNSELESIRARQREISNKTLAANKVIALESGISNAAGVIETLKQQIIDNQMNTGQSIQSLERRAAELNRKHQGDMDRIQPELDDVRKLYAKLRQELAVLPEPATDAALNLAKSNLAQAEDALNRLEYQLESARAYNARIEAEIQTLNSWLAQSGEIKTKSETLAGEIAHWNLLVTALGDNGLIALSIDDAGPTLSALTNDLLLAAYGPRFTVSIKTQEPKADGSLRETFDIVVFDADNEDRKSVAIMSGGERVYINEALARAIALYQSQLSGKRYGCLFADESDGALDSEKKQQFVQMKRKMLGIGGYKNEIFITHTPELWDLADAVIRM